MFEELDKYKNIVVTGCQRSGTTICAKMIAHDLNRPYVDESDFDVYVDHLFVEKLKRDEKKVIQAPAMFLDCCKSVREDTVIVFMKRDFEDIHKSEKRIAWGGEGEEMRKIKSIMGNVDGKSCELKWEYFKDHKPANYIVVEYESLKEHPMWVDKENRGHFSSKQTA